MIQQITQHSKTVHIQVHDLKNPSGSEGRKGKMPSFWCCVFCDGLSIDIKRLLCCVHNKHGPLLVDHRCRYCAYDVMSDGGVVVPV